MPEAAFEIKIPVDRKGKVLEYKLKDIGIDAFMAVRTLIEKQKWSEAFLLFFKETVIEGNVDDLRAEFDKNNSVPFMYLMRAVPEILEPVQGEVKKN